MEDVTITGSFLCTAGPVGSNALLHIFFFFSVTFPFEFSPLPLTDCQDLDP